MAYSTVANIQSEFKSLVVNSTSSVTTTEVEDFIAQSDAYIDSKLGLIYQTPITGAVALLVAKQLSIWITTQRIKNIMQVKTGFTETDQDSNSDFKKLADDMIADILAKKMTLQDATLLSSGDGVKSFTVDNDIVSTFDATEKQW